MTTQRETSRMIGDRNVADFVARGDSYETPVEALYSFLAAHTVQHAKYWECACGNGAIAKHLSHVYGSHNVIATDLNDWGYGTTGVDYLTTPVPEGVRTIITNPPYSLMNEFIEKALIDITAGVNLVYFLAPIRYLSSLGRLPYFRGPRFHGVNIFSRRLPRMHALEYTGKKSSSMIDFAWFIFSNRDGGRATVSFIDWKEWEPEGDQDE